MISSLKNTFNNIPDHRSNFENVKFSIADTALSGFAMFSLKYPSLLSFTTDGRGVYSSDDIHCKCCMEKVCKKTGKISYYHQTVGVSIIQLIIGFSQGRDLIKRIGYYKKEIKDL